MIEAMGLPLIGVMSIVFVAIAERILKGKTDEKKEVVVNKKYNVFYSWASENTNGQVIKEAITSAIGELNNELYGGYKYELIEAIRDDDPGSPNISQKVRDRIRKASVFIGDITPFHKGRRKCFLAKPQIAIPNPNVIFEYGFAEAYLGEDRCITFEDSALFSDNTNRPFDFQQYHRNSIWGKDLKSTENIIRDAIKKVVDKNPRKIRAGLLDEVEYDVNLSDKIYKELDIEGLVEMIETSVQQRRHGIGYSSRIDEAMKFFENGNMFFDEELETCRLQVSDSLAKLREWECANFFSDPRIGCSDVRIDPPDVRYCGGDLNKAKKDYYDKIEKYAALWEKLNSSVKQLKKEIREKLHIVFDMYE